MNNMEVEFQKDWLILDKYEFKILTMITVLAENNLAYRGTIKNICNFFSITAQKVNTDRIKKTITNLEMRKYIKVIKDENVYTLTLSKSAEKNKEIIKIKKIWVFIAKESESKTDWINVLKLWLLLIDNGKKIIKTETIAKELDISRSTVQRAKKTLEDIGAIKTTNEYYKVTQNIYYRLGQTIDVSAWVTRENNKK